MSILELVDWVDNALNIDIVEQRKTDSRKQIVPVRQGQYGDFAWGFGHSALLAKCHPSTRVTRSPKVKHSDAEVKLMHDHVNS